MKRQGRLEFIKLVKNLGIMAFVAGILIYACRRPEVPEVGEENDNNAIYYPDTTIIMKIGECARVVFTDSLQQDHLYSICFREVIETRTRSDSCKYNIHRYGRVILQLTNETTKESVMLIRRVFPCISPIEPSLHPECMSGYDIIDNDSLDYMICAKFLFPYPTPVNKGNIPDSAYTLYLSIIKK